VPPPMYGRTLRPLFSTRMGTVRRRPKTEMRDGVLGCKDELRGTADVQPEALSSAPKETGMFGKGSVVFGPFQPRGQQGGLQRGV